MSDGPDRLHAIDLAWLELQGDGPPIAIGTVAVVEGPVPTDEEVLALLSERLDRMPRLHQELTAPGAGVRRQAWVDAPGLDLRAHVRRWDASSGPGLDAAVAHVMEQPLPRDQPLWDAWIIDGLGHRWALVWRVHHTIADGLGTLLLLGHAFDLAPGSGPTMADSLLAVVGPRPATEAPGPPVEARAAPPVDVGRLLGALRAVVPQVVPALADVLPRPPSSLTGPVGPRRVWVSVDIPLPQVKATGRALGATVNEVVLASVAGGFRDLVAHRGEPVAGRVVRNLVPVSLRAPRDGTSHNQLSALLGHLPIGVADPVDRLRAVQAGLDHGRGTGQPVVASMLLGLADRAVPAGVQDVVMGSVGRVLPAWFFDTLTTNVPGPQFPVFLLGRRVRAMYPLIPVAAHTAITTGIFSYDGTLNVSVTGDGDLAADIEILAEGIGRAAADLAARVRGTARQTEPG
ncbi:MAG: wax ester/triacylglycerol synthase domain-containing protein [Candidatus Nanopelagicales bacterium]